MKNLIFIVLGIAVLIGAGVWYANKPQPVEETTDVAQNTEPVAKLVEVSVTNRLLAPNVVTVTEGETVTIRVNTDETGEFHISGYEIENDMETGTLLEFSFLADKPGRYNFELHPKTDEAAESHDEEVSETTKEEHEETEEDIVIGTFVVNPK